MCCSNSAKLLMVSFGMVVKNKKKCNTTTVHQ